MFQLIKASNILTAASVMDYRVLMNTQSEFVPSLVPQIFLLMIEQKWNYCMSN